MARRGPSVDKNVRLRLRQARGRRAKRSIAPRNRLVESHLGLVEPIARRIHRKLPPSFDLADLISVGALGLIDAAARFNRPAPPGRFPPFARQRIAGAILDSVRRRHYRDATHQPLDAVTETTEPDCSDGLEQAETVQRIRETLKLLPRAEARLLRLRYWHGLSLAKVALRMGVSTPTAFRLHRRALANLRSALAA